MSTKKINSVLDFPKPMVNTQLRPFLGQLLGYPNQDFRKRGKQTLSGTQCVIFIVDHRFYRQPPYICCENDRKRSIVVSVEILEDFCIRFLPKRLLASFCHSHRKYRVVDDKNGCQRNDTLNSLPGISCSSRTSVGFFVC
jgi:hypothetical protein